MATIDALSPSPCGFSFKTFQRTAFNKILKGFYDENHCAALISAPTGHGKTHLIGEAMRFAKENDPALASFTGICKQLVLTPKPVQEQTIRKLYEYHGLIQFVDYWIIAYSSLAAQMGQLFLSKSLEMKDGDVREVFTWDKSQVPLYFWLDECHYLMRGTSTRTRAMLSLLDLIDFEQTIRGNKNFNPRFCLSSATPFARVSEAQFFSVATRIPSKYGWATAPLNNKHWSSFAQDHSWNSDPSEHNLEAVKRLVTTLKPWIVKVPYQDCGDRWDIQVCEIPTAEARANYDSAYERYLKRLEELGEDVKGIEAFHIIREFMMAAEWEKAPVFARRMYESWKAGCAPSCAVLFKASLIRIMDCLVNEYGVPRDKIATIWGGLPREVAEAADAIAVKKKRGRQKKARVNGDSVLNDLCSEIPESNEDEEPQETEAEDDSEESQGLCESLRLGNQSPKQRQADIDRFQSGQCEFLIHTFAAGGTGIDLPRDKESLRPREKYMGVIYSDKQFLQANREARITSIGITNIIILLFADTIETQRVYPKLKKKLECLHEVMGARKSFQSALIPESLGDVRRRLELEEGKDDESEGLNLVNVKELDDATDNTIIDIAPAAAGTQDIKVTEPIISAVTVIDDRITTKTNTKKDQIETNENDNDTVRQDRTRTSTDTDLCSTELHVPVFGLSSEAPASEETTGGIYNQQAWEVPRVQAEGPDIYAKPAVVEDEREDARQAMEWV